MNDSAITLNMKASQPACSITNDNSNSGYLFNKLFSKTNTHYMRKIYLLVVMVLMIGAANAQVTLTATGGSPSGSFGTLKLAFDAINAGTHTGVIAISINANTTEGTTPANLNSSGAGSASYTSISIKPTADAVSISGNPITGFGVIQLNGADNVTIDGDNAGSAGTNRNLTVNNTTATATIANSAIRIATSAAVTSADNNTIKNCILNGNVTGGNSSLITSASGSSNSSFGIYCGGNGGATATGAPTAITSVTSNVAPTGTTINTLLIDNNAINQCARGIVFNGNAAAQSTGVTISNNTIGAIASLGSYPFTTPTTTVYTKGIWIAGTNAITISGNTVQNILSYVGTVVSGIELNAGIGSGTISVSNNTVSGVALNVAGANAVRGINISQAGGPYSVTGNTITNVQGSCNSATITNQPNALFVSTSAASATIEGNKISTVVDRNSGTFGVAGVFFNGGNNITFRNNFVSDVNQDMTGGSAFSPSFGVMGLRIAAGTGHKIYHNSFSFFGSLIGTAASSQLTACLAITSTGLTGIDVRNNIFSNVMTGGTTSIAHVGVSLPSSGTSAMNLTWNNNAYYSGPTAASQGIAQVGTTAGTGFYLASNFVPGSTAGATNFRNYSSTLSAATTNDNASYGSTAAAPFISTTNLHLDLASGEITNVEQKGATGTGVSSDIDGDARPNGATTFPDMGADEVATALCSSASGGTITPGTASICSGTTYAMSSTGATIGTGISYQWEVSATGGGAGFGSVSGGTGAATTAYAPAILTTGVYYYRLKTTCSAGPIGYSNELTLTVTALPVITVVSTAGTYCTSTTITAANGNDGTMYYQGTTSGGVSTATPSNSQLITTSGTYYFRARSGGGCWGPEGSAVIVIQAPASITTTPAAVCIGGSGTIAASSATGCVSLINSGTAFGGTWVAASDPIAKRPSTPLANSATCGFDLAITRNYVKTNFQVSISGAYTFEMNNDAAFDGMAYLVQGAFVPGTCPGAGTWIKGDDDGGIIDDEPLLTANLVTNTTYTMISTTYSSGTGTYSGAFSWTVTPPSGGQILLPSAPGNIEWYTAATGGTAFGTGSPFNPVGVLNSGLANTNTAATTVFYAACSNSSACRTPVNFVVNPNATITLSSLAGTDAQAVCQQTAITPITYLVANGGTGASIFSGSFPDGVTGGFSGNTYTISGTPSLLATAGNYPYTIHTSGGCGIGSVSGSITVNANSTITLSSAPGTLNQTVCNGANVTTVTFAVGGGATGASITSGSLPSGVTGSYTPGLFTISGPATSAGSYPYTITTSGSGCTEAQISGAITVSGSLGATYTKTNLSSCAMVNDGSITVSPTGGSGSYTYSWTGATGPGNPAPMNFTAGNVNPLTGLTFGDYNVTVTDAGGCGSIMINTIHIEYAFLVHITHSGTNANSCNGSTGSIILYGSAGVQPYTYSVVPGTNAAAGVYVGGNTFTGLAAGNYTGWIKDAAGCAQSRNITVAAAPALVISPFVRNASSCNPDGSIEIYRTGGIPPYTYALDAMPYQSGNTFTGLAAGSHTAYVKDGANCITSTSVMVTAGSGLFPTALKTNTSTCIEDGTAQLNANGGGVGPYTYKLDIFPSTPLYGYQSGNSFSNLAAGNYIGTVKDSKGCTGTVNVTINLSPITVSSTVTNASSCMVNDGKIQLFRTGGVGPFTYSIDGGANYFISNVFTGVSAGSHDCYVKDSKFCTAAQLGVVVGPACDPLTGNAPTSKGSSSVTKVIAAESRVQAYPNPSATEFTLVLEGFTSEKVNITVTDIMGRKVYMTEGTGKQQYHFGNKFISGIYNVQVVQGDKKQNIKLVKE